MIKPSLSKKVKSKIMHNHKKHINSFTEINKSNIYKVPDGYFDQLANTIQTRTAGRISSKPFNSALFVFWKHALRYSVVLILLITVAVYWNNVNNAKQKTAEELIAVVNTSDLIDYLTYVDDSGYDLIDALDTTDIEGLVIDSSSYLDDLEVYSEFNEDYIL